MGDVENRLTVGCEPVQSIEQTVGLQRGLPSSDKVRIDGYLDDIREIERRIKTVLDREAQAGSRQNVPEAPVGSP